jgi:hydroxyacylglutathione hydrolase
LIDIVVVDTPSLGDRGYLATDGSVALVVDPQRDVDRVLAAAAERGVSITHVLETHIHNDYVTGGLALARQTGAAYYVNGADPVGFDRFPAADGDHIEVGQMRVKVIATPGHTFTHLSYALSQAGAAPGVPAGEVVAVFTGGSLLNGSTGRTDLLGDQHAAELARAQHRSARRLAAELPGAARIYPTHGFGSFCSATPTTTTTGAVSTIGAERLGNPAFALAESDYVESTLAGLDVYPAYYAHMGPANLAGPPAPDLAPPRPAEPGELRRRLDAGEWVVDLRSRLAFAAGHLRGALQFELSEQLATYIGWLIPWGTPLTLIGQTETEVAAAQRELVRIGIDGVQAGATGAPADWAAGESLARYPVADFAAYEQARASRPVVLLDVRRESEWNAARIAGAVHIPLHELAGRMAEIGGPENDSAEIWVHCQSGFRAAIAASLMDAAGHRVVLIDEDFSVAQRTGLASAGQVPAF